MDGPVQLPGAQPVNRVETGKQLWPRLLRRCASESGRLRHGDGTHGRSDRCRRSFVLPILSSDDVGYVIEVLTEIFDRL